MHRELKIGLAVGVLLVGIVAAFFFRRHDDPELEIQELENTAELDVDIAEVKEASQFIEDLGADSLAIVELVLAFEEQFDIEIPDEDTEKIRTVGDAVSYIASRTN